LFDAGGRPILDVTEERSDSGEPGVPGARGVVAYTLKVVEERQHKLGSKILDGEISGAPFEPICHKTDE
jgi:hypothetical protein